jgi:hypothetical protein
MNHNNRNWYTIFVGPEYADHKPLPAEYTVLAHVRGEGDANLIVYHLQQHYKNIRTAEGKHATMTADLIPRLFGY